MKIHLKLLSVLLSVFFFLGVAQFAYSQNPSSKKPLVVPGQIVMRLATGSNAALASSLAEKADCKVLGEIAYSPGFYLLELKAITKKVGVPTRAEGVPVDTRLQAAVDTLTANAGVTADPNYLRFKTQATSTPTTFTPNDLFYPAKGIDPGQWGMRLVNMPRAWSIQTGKKAVIVAVIDSGFDRTHPDFTRGTGSVALPGTNVTIPTAPTTDVTDTDGHGTFVSGVIIASTNNSIGVASVAGLNTNGVSISLLPIAASVGGGFTSASIVAGINYAVANGANVINMSFGGLGYTGAEFTAINDALARNVILVAAAGNDGDTSVNYPASFPGVISVSAVGINSTLASYSTFGGNVAIAAPGGDFSSSDTSQIHSTLPVAMGSYGYESGTSFAAPHVAGAAALLLAAGADPTKIRSVLQGTATRLDEVPSFTGGNKYGAGLLNVGAALEFQLVAQPIVLGSDGRSVTPSGQPINDRGVTLDRTLPINIQITGAQNIESANKIIVRIILLTAAGETEIVRYVGGVDFDVPTATTADPIIVTVPKSSIPQTVLGDGRYRIEVTVTTATDVKVDNQFATIRTQSQGIGRSLFALPFRAPTGSTTVEQTILGSSGSTFALYRWDVYSGSYASFFSNSAQNILASFRAPAVGSIPGSPIPSFETSNPGVSISPVGLGYWINLDRDTPLKLVGTRVSSSVGVNIIGPTAANPGGWNLVGNPYTFAIDWNSVSVQYQGQPFTLSQAIDNSLIRRFVVGYEYGARDYYFGEAPNGQLRPFNAYWVQAQRDVTLIFSPAVSQFPDNTRAAQNGLSLPAGGWRGRLMATVAGDHDGQNYFGQVNGASAAEDKYDVAKPPSGAGHAYVRFIADAANGRKAALAADMRPAGGSTKQEWTVAVTSDKSDANVTLTWDGLNTAPRRSRFMLKDGKTGARFSLNGRSSYSFPAGEAGTTRVFTLSMEPQGSAGALAIINPRVVRTRAVQGMSLHFRVNRDVSVQGFIRTTGGKVVATMQGASRATGSQETTLRWDGKTEKGATAPVGGYVMDVIVTDESGEPASLRMPIMQVR